MRFILLMALWGLLASCGRKSDAQSDGPEDPELEAFLSLDIEAGPDREASLALKEKYMGGMKNFRISNEPLKIPNSAIDFEGREVRYFLKCFIRGYDRPHLFELIKNYCEDAASIDSEGIITILSPYALGFDAEMIRMLKYQRIDLKIFISNGIEQDRLDFIIPIRLIPVDIPSIDLKDREYLPSELLELPESNKIILQNSAVHGYGNFRKWGSDRGRGGYGGGVSTGWYLGSDGTHHYMASAHHAVTQNPDSPLSKLEVYLPYLEISGKVDQWVYYDDPSDFAIYTVKLDENSAISKLQETPINYTYIPSTGDGLYSVGFANTDSVYLYPGVDTNPTCRVLSEELHTVMPDSPTFATTGYPTGCQVSLGDSGGPIALKSIHQVVGLVTAGFIPIDQSWAVSREIAERQFKSGQYYGATLVPFSTVRRIMMANRNLIAEDYLPYISQKFGL